MQISDKSQLDLVGTGLLINAHEGKCDQLSLEAIVPSLIFLVRVARAAATAPAYPLKASANGRYAVDNNNVPFLIIGDAPHSILANLNNADATGYLTNRGTNGFNRLLTEPLCGGCTGSVCG